MMAIAKHAALIVLATALVSGCSHFRNPCKTPGKDYYTVNEKPALAAPTGLSVPEPDPNLSIPDSSGMRVPYAREVDDQRRPGKTRVQCLSEPPPYRERG